MYFYLSWYLALTPGGKTLELYCNVNLLASAITWQFIYASVC